MLGLVADFFQFAQPIFVSEHKGHGWVVPANVIKTRCKAVGIAFKRGSGEDEFLDTIMISFEGFG